MSFHSITIEIYFVSNRMILEIMRLLIFIDKKTTIHKNKKALKSYVRKNEE